MCGQSKPAVIAGFGPGLGEATAIALVQEDLKVGLLARSPERLQRMAKADEGNLFPFQVDVTDPAAVEAAVEAIEERLGPLSCAIYNAGEIKGRNSLPRGSDALFEPDHLAEIYVQLHKQHRSTWTHELDVHPWCEKF